MQKGNLEKCPATGKIRFPRRKVAIIAMNEANANGLKLQAVYRCRFCKDWHTSKQLPRRNEPV